MNRGGDSDFGKTDHQKKTPTGEQTSMEVMSNDSSVWVDRAAELASWAMDNLVNRRDAWGSYLPREHRGDRNTAKTAHGDLTVEILERHFAGADVGHLVGLHAIAPGNTCRWVAIDIDHHGDHDEELAQLNFYAATAWYDRLIELGFRPLLIDSNGRGGFHLIVLFSEPVASTVVFNFGRSFWDGLPKTSSRGPRCSTCSSIRFTSISIDLYSVLLR